MKRFFTMVVVLALAGVGIWAATVRNASKAVKGKAAVIVPVSNDSRAMLRRLESRYSKAELAAGSYVGSEFCIACHQDKSTWRDSKHAQALRRPMAMYTLQNGKGVVADYDKNGVDDFQQGLDFNAISSVFDAYKPNAPVLSYEAGTDAYFITIGQLKMPVVCTQGGTGDWKQRYLLRVPVTDLAGGLSAENYVSPIQYNEKTRQYVLYNASNWYDAAKQPKFTSATTASQLAAANGSTYSKKCIGCHTTGLRKLQQTAQNEWVYSGYVATLYEDNDPGYFDYDHDGLYDIVNVGCESCHGPGSRHILGGGDPTKIVNPDNLSADKGNEVCGQCHSRVTSVPNHTFEWPIKDDTMTPFLPGAADALSTYYADAPGLWPDGNTSTQHHQQYQDFFKSPHPTNPYHKLTCFTCHDPHAAAGDHQIVTETVQGGITIPTAVDNDTLCLACHAGFGPFAGITKAQVADYANNVAEIGTVVSGHSKHYYNPEGKIGVSRCTKCHMPTMATSAITYDIHNHTFEVVAPEKTISLQPQGGMPNACAGSCHQGRPLAFTNNDFACNPFATWNDAGDVNTANFLKKYYGPGGTWWNTTPTTSPAYKWMMKSAAPGQSSYTPPNMEDDN